MAHIERVFRHYIHIYYIFLALYLVHATSDTLATQHKQSHAALATMSPTSFIQWFLHFIAHFFGQTPKRLHDVGKAPSIFACANCRAPLHAIHRFDDQSYCKSCRADIDSDGAFSD